MDFQILGFLGILTGFFTFLFIAVVMAVYAYRNRDKTDGQIVGAILLFLLFKVLTNIQL